MRGVEYCARSLPQPPSSPQRGEGGAKRRMRGAEGHLSLAPASPKRPLIASLRSALLPAGEKREHAVSIRPQQQFSRNMETAP